MKSLCKIAVPVTLQSMLQASFSIVDQIMIGQLGETNISAVGLGSNFSLIFSVVIGAVGAVAGILIAQFMGAEDKKEAWCSFDVSLICGIMISALFLLAAGAFPLQILGLYTEDMSIINTGAVYFRIVAFSYIPMAVSNILSAWLRCREHATIPFLASFGAVIENTGLNYLLIFGKLGFSCMGIKGAAIATLISQLFNLVFIAVGFALCIRKDEDKPVWSLRFSKITIKDYLIMIMPILVSEFLWSLGENVYSAIYGNIGTQACAAMTMTTPIQCLMVGALSGLSKAAAILIGKSLGTQEYDRAYRDAQRLMRCGLAASLVLSALLLVFGRLYTTIYRVEPEGRATAYLLLVVFAVISPVKVQNMILGGGILKSGGKTNYTLAIDLIGTWGFGVPLGFLAAFVLKLPVAPVYFLLSLEECVRLALSLRLFKKRIWMQQL